MRMHHQQGLKQTRSIRLAGMVACVFTGIPGDGVRLQLFIVHEKLVFYQV